VDPLWEGGILPSNRYGGCQGPTGLMGNDLWDVSREGIAKLHVSLKLPIDPDEAHRSDRVVMVDMPLSAWGEIKHACNKATRLLEVGKDVSEKWSRVPMTP